MRKSFIVFRKRFILPAKFALERFGMLFQIKYPRRVELLTRINVINEALVFALKKNKRDEIKVLEARLKELNWIAYGNTEKEKSE